MRVILGATSVLFQVASVLGVVIFQTTALYEVFAENGKGLDVVYSLVLVYFALVTLAWLAMCAHTIRENPIVEVSGTYEFMNLTKCL